MFSVQNVSTSRNLTDHLDIAHGYAYVELSSATLLGVPRLEAPCCSLLLFLLPVARR